MISFFPTDQNVGRSIGGYNDNLTREAMGRMQEAVAITQAELQAKAQREAQRQSYFQNREANALEQQRLNQLGQYQQGQLGNQQAATQAQMEWQKALMGNNASESEKDRQNRLEMAKLSAGARSNAPTDFDIQSVNNAAQSAASRYNTLLDLEKKSADTAIQTAYRTDAQKEWFNDSNSAKKRATALEDLKASNYSTQVQRILGMLNMDQDSAGLLEFDGQKFIPKLIRIPGTTTSTNATAAPRPAEAAPRVNPASLIEEARDAIARGANPAAVQERLQERLQGLGVTMPAPSYFGGMPANVWPPMAAAPAAPVAPPLQSNVLPIPGYFGGAQ